VDPMNGTRHSLCRLRLGFSPQGDQRARKQSIAVMFVLIMTFSVSPMAPAQRSLPGEYEVKAAFLFNFAKFVEWPPSSFATPQSPFAICLLGQDPFGNVLDDTLRGKVIGDRPIVTRRLKDKAEARSCQIVFVSSSESAHLAEIIGSMPGSKLLLVGETKGFAASGGTIEFTHEDNHVRFSINTDAADRSGLKYSSKLLALAKIVHDEGRSRGD